MTDHGIDFDHPTRKARRLLLVVEHAAGAPEQLHLLQRAREQRDASKWRTVPVYATPAPVVGEFWTWDDFG